MLKTVTIHNKCQFIFTLFGQVRKKNIMLAFLTAVKKRIIYIYTYIFLFKCRYFFYKEQFLLPITLKPGVQKIQ